MDPPYQYIKTTHVHIQTDKYANTSKTFLHGIRIKDRFLYVMLAIFMVKKLKFIASRENVKRLVQSLGDSNRSVRFLADTSDTPVGRSPDLSAEN